MSDQRKLMAGAAQVDITPSLGSIIGVDFFSHYARIIHEKLYSKSIVFQQNVATVAAFFIHADLYLNEVRAIVLFLILI